MMCFFPSAATRETCATQLYRMRLRYGFLYGEVQATSASIEGLAMWIPSDRAEMTLWSQMRCGGIRLFRQVGREAIKRMLSVASHDDALRRRCAPPEYWFLSVLAVDPPFQGKGHASLLLRSMHARLDVQGLACYVETTEERLLPFYERFGYEVIDSSIVPGSDLCVWALVRESQR